MIEKEANSKSLVAFTRIFQSRGLEGIWLHLLNIWFDQIREIDTCERHQTEGVIKTYVTTSQASIKQSLGYAINYLYKNEIDKSFNFIELGAGKGKVIIILKELILKKYNINLYILAIEIDKLLCKILKENLYKTGFFFDSDENLIMKPTNSFKFNIKIKVIPEAIESVKSKDEFNKLIDSGRNIFYCCDSLPKENLLNLVKQISKGKNNSRSITNLLIYANPRYLDDLLLKFGNGVNLINQKLGVPQESYAILAIQ